MSSPLECNFLDLDELKFGQVIDISVRVGNDDSPYRPWHLCKTNRRPTRAQRHFKSIDGVYHEVLPGTKEDLGTNPTFNFFMIHGAGYEGVLVRPSRIITLDKPWFDGVRWTHVNSITDDR